MLGPKKRKIILFSPVGTLIVKHANIVTRSAIEGLKKAPVTGKILTAFEAAREPFKIEFKRQKALERLFGTSTPIYLVGSDAHPLYPLLPGEAIYPSDKNAAEKLRDDFFGELVLQPVDDYAPFEKQGSLICLGSSVATEVNRSYLGDPKNPKMNLVFPKYETQLHYNYVAPDKGVVACNRQLGWSKPWKEPNWGIKMEDDEIFPVVQEGWLKTDYLLVTRIPTHIRGAGDVMIFGGCHGVGTQATELLLRKLDLDALKKITTKIGDSSHYQALLLVGDISHKRHSSGKYIELVDAKPLKIKWKQQSQSDF